MEGNVMRKLTKLQRNVIYKEALTWYLEEIKDHDVPRGMCMAVWSALRVLSEEPHSALEAIAKKFEQFSPYNGGMETFFPEIYNEKPDDEVGSYWFPPE